MKIGSGFAAVEGRFLWRVDKNLQAIFDLAGGREVNEAIVACVKTADEAGEDACRFSQAKIDTAIDFHVEIGIADDELKRAVGRARRRRKILPASGRVENNSD